MIRQSKGGFISSEQEFGDQGNRPGDEGQAGRGGVSWVGLRSGEPAIPPEWIWGINYCSSFAENELTMAFYEKHKPSRLEGEFSEERTQSPTRSSGPKSRLCLPPCPQPQPALCTWLSICKQRLQVNSLSFVLLGPQGDTRSPTNMKRVNEPQLQSNYSPAMTECGSQNQDWAVVQLRVESVSHRGGNLLPAAVARAHKAAH